MTPSIFSLQKKKKSQQYYFPCLHTILSSPGPEDDVLYYEVMLLNLSEQLNLDSIIQPEENLQIALEKSIKNDYENCKLWLKLAITSLYVFIQSNWTGPSPSPSNLPTWCSIKTTEAHNDLSLNDQCDENSSNLSLLFLAKKILSTTILQSKCPTTIWWLFRTNMIHQRVLEEDSHLILEETEKILNKIQQEDPFNFSLNNYHKTLFFIEASQFWLLYRRVQNVESLLEQAESSASLKINLNSALGKRTKYQVNEKPQLFLIIENKKEENYPFISSTKLPQSMSLNDDLRLENINFSDDIGEVKLGTIEEAIVLTRCVFLQINQPHDKLTEEELTPYINTIISSTKNWPIKMESLRRRCLLEMRDKRSIERALSQSEHLLAQYKETTPSIVHRCYHLFASGMKPIWYFKEILADTMLSLGMIKGALELYLQLHQWEQVIVCYTLLDLRHKAAEIIRQEIEKNNYENKEKLTVKLWCLLGDAEQNVEHYETAWKLSEEKSSRVQRHWGIYYFAKQNYTEAIPHLKLSVDLNNIQENVWIRLGFATLQVENWTLAATAYRRYCALEQKNFEAWNNLAKAYIKLGDKPRAWRSLQDAVKCNYEKWEVWDNLMVVSIDLRYFSEVIRCYNRILDLKDKHVDIQVLEILTKAILKNFECRDSDGNVEESIKYREKLMILFGRLTAKVFRDSDLWRLYAEVTIGPLKNDDHEEEDVECKGKHSRDIKYQKAAQFLQNAYRIETADSKWFKSIQSTIKVLELCIYLADTYFSAIKNSTVEQKRSLLGTAKLSLQSVISKVKQEDLINDGCIGEAVDKLQGKLDRIVGELEGIKNLN